MLRTFIFAEPRTPLKEWELSLLQDIYVYWPRPEIDPQWTKPAKNMTDETAERIVYLMGRDIRVHEKYPMLPKKHEVYGYADWIPIIKAVYKKKKKGPITQLQWDKRQWKTLDTMADHQQIKSLKKWIQKHPDYNINTRDRNGINILERQSKRQNNKVVATLLDIPTIIVTEKAIADIDDNALKNKMIRINLMKEYQNASQSVSTSNESKIEVKEECGHYSINQGQVGICYIVSVITLFRNERTILKWLKSEERSGPLPEIVEMLDTDYSGYDFTKKCPNLPISMRRAVTNNRTLRGSLKKNAGNAYAILLYIMNIIDIWTELSVYTHVITENLSKIPTVRIMEFERSFELGDNQIGYLDITCDFEFSEYSLNSLDFVFTAPLKGFIMRLWNPSDKFNHVIAGCICDDELHICNSWVKGCQTNVGEVVSELTNNGTRKLWIVHIGCLFAKRVLSSGL